MRAASPPFTKKSLLALKRSFWSDHLLKTHSKQCTRPSAGACKPGGEGALQRYQDPPGAGMIFISALHRCLKARWRIYIYIYVVVYLCSHTDLSKELSSEPINPNPSIRPSIRFAKHNFFIATTMFFENEQSNHLVFSTFCRQPWSKTHSTSNCFFVDFNPSRQ